MDEKMYSYKYPHPAVTTDCVIFGFDGKRLHLLLIERGLEPYRGMWALPGGFMNMDETVEQCAARELFEETGLQNIFMEQFQTFSDVQRDPRERVITIAFLALVSKENYQLLAGDDAARAEWFDWNELPPLAFDHQKIIDAARQRLCELLKTKPIAFKLLGNEFKMSELQTIYEVINGTQYDRRNFHRKMLASGFVEDAKNADEIAKNSRISCDAYLAEESGCMPMEMAMDCSIAPSIAPKLAKPKKSGVQKFRFNQKKFDSESEIGWRKYPFDF